MFRIKQKILSGSLALSLALGGILSWHVFYAYGTDYTWDNGGAGGLWSDCNNWTSDTCPGAGDIAVFNPAVSDTASIIDGAFGGTVGGVNIMAGFTSTVTQARDLTVGTSSWTQDGGIFSGATQDVTITGDFTVNAGTYTATSGITRIGRSTLGVTADTFTVGAGVIFTPNGGTLRLGRSRNISLDVDSSLTVFNLTFNTTSDGILISLATGDTLVVTGALTLTEGILSGGTIETQGTFSQATTYGACSFLTGGDTIIHVTEPLAIAPPLDDSGYVCFPGLNLDDAGASFTGAGVGSYNFMGGDLTITAGTFNATAATTVLDVGADFTLAGGTFNHNNGPWLFRGGAQTITGSPTFAAVEVRSTALTLAAGSTTVIEGDLTMTGAYGDMSVRSGTPGTQATLDFNGTTAQLANLDVQDNIWLDATPAVCFSGCIYSGNNTNWDFNQAVTITDISGNTTEAGGTATFTAVLTQKPDSNVTLGVTSSDLTEGTVSAASLVFTTLNWATPQTITVTGVDDLVDDEAVAFTVLLAAAVSTDAGYSGVNPRDLTVTNLDNDATADAIDFDNPTDYIEQTANKTELTGTVATLAETDAIALDVAASTNGGDIIYDSQNDFLWFAKNTAHIYQYDIGEASLTAFPSGGTGAGKYLAYDSEPTRNRIWMTVDADDEVVAFNDDGSVFGHFAVNPQVFSSSPTRILFSNAGDAVAANDSFWIGNENATGQPSVTKLLASSGAPFDTDLATSTYPVLADTTGTYSVLAMAYDATDNQIWTYVNNVLVGLNAATGAPINGTLANSSFFITTPALGDYAEAVYDSYNDFVWVMKGNEILGFDTDTQTVPIVIETGATDTTNNLNTDLAVDNTNNLLIITDLFGNVYQYDVVNLTFLDTYTASEGVTDVVLGDANNFWMLDETITLGDFSGTVGTPQVEHIIFGATTGAYYTVVTDTGAQIDSSAWTSLTDVAVTETLNSGNIYYSLTFDCCSTYSVFNSGWRPIASSAAAVHGGVEGTWYYRNNADAWSAASSNNAQTAISQAVAAGANNQMTGTTLNGLTSANLIASGGWTVASEDISVGATFVTANFANNPEVDNLAFTASDAPVGGNGSSAPGATYTGNESLSAPSCTPTATVSVTLGGSRIAAYLLAETADFLTSSWTEYAPDTLAGDSMTVPFTLSSGDGIKTVYARFKSSTSNQSETLSVEVTLDTNTQCVEAPVEVFEDQPETPPAVDETAPDNGGGSTDNGNGDVDNTNNHPELAVIGCEGQPMHAITNFELTNYRIGVSPTATTDFPFESLHAGDYIRAENFTTVYCVTQTGDRRAFMDETSFFTLARSFSPVKWVAGETLAAFPLKAAMLPNQNTVFLKFESTNNVYAFQQNPADPSTGILRWITTEELAAFIGGPDWADYVIDLNPTLIDQFEFAAPFLNFDDVIAAKISVSGYRSRLLLNEQSSRSPDAGIVSPVAQAGQELLNILEDNLQQGLNALVAVFHRHK